MIFPGELRFSLFSDNARLWVWRLNNQELDIKRLQPTVKHGGYSGTVWDAILSDGRYELVECQEDIISVKYVSILQESLLPIFFSSKMMQNGSLFMEDGASCYAVENTQDCLLQNRIRKLPWPSQSTDMNLIVHLKAILQPKNIEKMNHRPSSKVDVLRLLHETWQEDFQDTFRELIKCMPRRVLAIKKHKEYVSYVFVDKFYSSW